MNLSGADFEPRFSNLLKYILAILKSVFLKAKRIS